MMPSFCDPRTSWDATDAGQVLVLTEGLEVPTGRRDDDLVHHRAEPDGLALAAVVRVAGGIVVAGSAPRGSPRRAVAVRGGRIPRCGQPDRGGQRGRLSGEANPGGAIREVDVRDAETRHAGGVPDLAGTRAEGAAAVGEVVRLGDGHHADELVKLGVGQRAATPDGPGAHHASGGVSGVGGSRCCRCSTCARRGNRGAGPDDYRQTGDQTDKDKQRANAHPGATTGHGTNLLRRCANHFAEPVAVGVRSSSIP